MLLMVEQSCCMKRYSLLLLLIRLLLSLRCLSLFFVLFYSVSLLRFLPSSAIQGTCQD